MNATDQALAAIDEAVAARGGPGSLLVRRPFVRVGVADLLEAPPEPQEYWWHGLVPAGHCTLLGAHGGTGKSMVALMLTAALTAGRPLFGVATRQARVAYLSAEDPARVTRRRLHHICKGMQLDPADLADSLHLLDATSADPVLFHEVSAGGTRQGLTTPAYQALAAYLTDHRIDVLIVDNASDVYDASENDRARVRAFMRALSQLAQPGRGVLLLAHVDKGTSRGDRTGTEGYSGSTAWHNSARSRIFLSRDKDGGLLLEHQKNNLDPLAPPIRLAWPTGGLPQLDEEPTGIVRFIADRNAERGLLRALHAAYVRGEWVSTDSRSRYHAAKVLADEPGYPACKPTEVFRMLASAERGALVEREAYKDRSRRHAERWKLTPAGLQNIGIAASAAGATGNRGEATCALDARACASAASAALGGVGDLRAAELAAGEAP